MALVRNISVNIGFPFGLNNWFTPILPFCNPMRSWGVFNFFNIVDCFSALKRNNYRYSTQMLSANTPIFQSLPTQNQDDFNINNSVWSNFKFDFSNYTASPNIDSFVFAGTKGTKTNGTEPKTSTTTETEVSDMQKTNNSSKSKTTSGRPTVSNTRKLRSKGKGGKINYLYKNMSRSQALSAAKRDNNLEDLREKKYTGWKLKQTFGTDIPFAKKGTSDILQKVYEITGIKLEISSALGTNGNGSGSPHKGMGYASHHNAENPKLDISYSSIAGKNMDGYKFADILWNTGLFSWIYVEGDHLDVQIDPDAYSKYA